MNSNNNPPARTSSYVLSIPLAKLNSVLLLHGYTGALDIVSTPVFEAIEKYGDSISLSNLPIELVERLSTRGYVVQMTKEEEHDYFIRLATNIQRVKHENAANTFWVIPTYMCNLRCSYCFQSHLLHRGAGRYSAIMSQERIKELMRAMRRLGGPTPACKRGASRYLTLFGGEPLMTATRNAVEEIVARGLDEGYKVGAVTNGVELNNFLDLIGPTSIRWLQITLDGSQAQHDSRRRLPQVGENYSRVVPNITRALAQGSNVFLRTNVDATILEDLERLEELAEREGWFKLPNFYWTASPVEPNNKFALAKRTVTPLQIYERSKSKKLCSVRPVYRERVLFQLQSLLTDTIDSLIETSACGAHTGMWFFDPFGAIYTCAEQAGKEEFAVGHYHKGTPVIQTDRLQDWHRRHVGSVEECSRCAYAFFCGGGCANAARIDSGTMFAARCFGIQDVFNASAIEFINEGVPPIMDHRRTPIGDYWLRELNSDELVKANLSVEDYVHRYCENVFPAIS